MIFQNIAAFFRVEDSAIQPEGASLPYREIWPCLTTKHLILMAASHWPMLPWVAFAKFLLDLVVEIVFLILRFPVAERDAQRMQQRSVRIDAGLLQGLVFVFGNENQIARLAPILEQRFERLAHHRFARRAGDAAQRLEVVEVVLDKELAHEPRNESPTRGCSTSAQIFASRKAWLDVHVMFP